MSGKTERSRPSFACGGSKTKSQVTSVSLPFFCAIYLLELLLLLLLELLVVALELR